MASIFNNQLSTRTNTINPRFDITLSDRVNNREYKISIDTFLSLIGVGGNLVYNLTSPTTLTVGNLQAGTNIAGLGIDEIIERMVIAYNVPDFNNFRINGIPTLVEVGYELTGSQVFQWGLNNAVNIDSTYPYLIRDVTGGSAIITGIPTTSTSVNYLFSSLIIGTTPRTWLIEGRNTQGALFNDTFTINSTYPYYYGTVSSGGALPGANRPNDIAIANIIQNDLANKVVASSNGTITVTFNSTSDDYIWFATPNSSNTKTSWFVDVINNGTIGGSVSVGGNLFPDFDNEFITTTLWSNVEYKIYVSNYQTASSQAMQLRN